VAAGALGIDLAQHHLALILWRQGTAADGRDDAAGWSRDQLELAVNRAAGRLRAPATLTMPPEETLTDVRGDALACWLTSPVPFAAAYLESLTELFAALFAARPEVRVAVGVPGPGQAGFRRSHLAAVDAYRVARAAGRTGVTGYAEVGALALLSADQERARWFVAEELGRLAEADPGLGDLRETALCYLDCGRNLVDTARRLHVHRNTVVYRLAKIQRLLGRPLDERAFATQAALTLATLDGGVYG
jgi:sugar diacid utilization regulator